MIAKWLAIAALSIAPLFVDAQVNGTKSDSMKTLVKPAVWVPMNGASVMANDLTTSISKPNEVRLVAAVSSGQESTTLMANYREKIGSVLVGGAVNAGRTQTKGTDAGNSFVLQTGAGVGKFMFGAKLPLSGTEQLTPGHLSIRSMYNGSKLRAGADFTPSKGLEMPGTVLSGDFFFGKNDVSGMLKAQKGKKPLVGIGLERNLGKGWQMGGSVQPERTFFRGKMNPILSLRHSDKKTLFHVDVVPQQKTLRIGVGWRY